MSQQAIETTSYEQASNEEKEVKRVRLSREERIRRIQAKTLKRHSEAFKALA